MSHGQLEVFFSEVVTVEFALDFEEFLFEVVLIDDLAAFFHLLALNLEHSDLFVHLVNVVLKGDAHCFLTDFTEICA